ncbi:HCLS1-binding protein 3 isoform X2 [Exaiptasia diaphana]|uniref:PX domain-containing protein n=1 Tax=Exaiptasia diaphana TaxID=2652724 RepID=A0A913WNU5_EXADI|nr:HCLS1-binding protein 3 isoform X2 [Exaiptasia diaphana]KXJ05900.1 HCLS1-binding protein 3 [Exaiptasia diaphana]
MANVTITSRELKNKHTGIDIYVPKHETIPGHLGGTVLYHVIVVTRLFYFKTQGKYKESDVVQFMIPQKFAAFEDLYHKLNQKFSSVVFSPLPKKVLLTNESVINERQQVMESVLQQVAKTPKLACSSITLEFLGVHTQKEGTPLDERDSHEDQAKQKEKTADPSSKDEPADIDLFGADQQEQTEQADDNDVKVDEDDDLLLFTKSAKPLLQESSIFKVDDKEDDINDLFIPAGALESNPVKIEVEDNSELLNIDDDLDKLLNVSKPKKPPKPSQPKPPIPKPRMKPKPQLKPKPAPKPRFQEAQGSANDELFAMSNKKSEPNTNEDLFAPRKSSFRKQEDDSTLDDIFKKPDKKVFPDDEDDALFKTSSDMNVDDISSYIQQSLKDNNDSLDLF